MRKLTTKQSNNGVSSVICHIEVKRQSKLIFWFLFGVFCALFGVLRVFFGVLGVLLGVLGVLGVFWHTYCFSWRTWLLFGVLGILVGVLQSLSLG